MDAERVTYADAAGVGVRPAMYSGGRLEWPWGGFGPVEPETRLVGLAPGVDAAVYRLDDERALIFTLDFFPPVVDRPSDYGAIAAANALNDVFGMGCGPLFPLPLQAFPEGFPIGRPGHIFREADKQVRATGGMLH